MKTNALKKRSKKLSLVLRHNPAALGITLDSHGWTSIDILLEKLSRNHLPTTRAQLGELVTTNDKKRFSISEDGLRIRANQGHSIPVDLQLEEKAPPTVLYHGTAESSVCSIQEQGLQKRSRQHLHLSRDQKTAHLVGSRHGKPIILEIQTGLMHAEGHTFYLSENGVWLTDHVPPEFIKPTSDSTNKTHLSAIRANITTLAVDAIVNAANSSLLGGGGVDGAIHRAAGSELVHECRLLGGCKTGQAKITQGYKLPAKNIIHTVGPVWQGGDKGEADLLHSCYRESLALCEAHNLKTVAFPCISTGVYNYPSDLATKIAIEACSSFTNLDITFCCFDEESLSLYTELADALILSTKKRIYSALIN